MNIEFQQKVGSVMISMLNNAYENQYLEKIIMPELFSKFDITEELHMSMFDNMSEEDKITIIKRIVMNKLGLASYDVINRKREYVDYRQIVSYLLRKTTELSLNQIGKIIGKDHATVLIGIRKVQGYIETNREYRDLITNIENDLGIDA